MKSFVFLLIILISSLSFSANEQYIQIFNHQLKKHKINKDNLAVMVSSGEGDHTEILISHNSTKKMIPASITKILTASAVLDHFLPGTKFKTQLYLDQKPTSATQKGHIYLKGGGDPSFVSENMWFLVNTFKRNGVLVIEGDIVVDDSLFDQVRFDTSRENIRVDRAYDAPVGAMSFNWNAINVFVRPTKKGEKANVFLDPENEYTKLENSTKTVDGDKSKIEVRRKANGDHDVLIVTGTIGVDSKEVVVFKNITRPDLWSGYQLKSFLAQRGIMIRGKVRAGKVPDGAILAAESESKPVEHILADLNKFSNNYVAEMLTKNLGLSKKQPATITAGMEIIREHLTKIGINPKDYDLFNPSGLTRDNKFSAEVTWKVLRHLRDDFRVQPELLASLPIAGVDGTLKRRMKDSPAERWVRGKTGLLTGVVSLAGYAGKKDGTPLTYAFIYNGSQDGAQIRRFYDELLIDLVK